jgi:2'-5' RNA ligase
VVEPRPHTDETFRSFIAVPLDASVRCFAEERIRALRERPGGEGVRWARPENLHVTLHFLGNIERAIVPELVAAVGEETAGLAPFTAQVGGVRTFPPGKRPRVVVLDVGPEAALAELASAVERGVQRVGFEAEERPFRPHLTLGRAKRARLGRAKRARRAPSFPDTSDLEASQGASFEVAESVLFQSELLRSGAHYAALERFPLKGEAGT